MREEAIEEDCNSTRQVIKPGEQQGRSRVTNSQATLATHHHCSTPVSVPVPVAVTTPARQARSAAAREGDKCLIVPHNDDENVSSASNQSPRPGEKRRLAGAENQPSPPEKKPSANALKCRRYRAKKKAEMAAASPEEREKPGGRTRRVDRT